MNTMRTLALALALGFVLPQAALAAARPLVTLPQDSVVGEVTLRKGAYHVELSPAGDSVAFTKGKKTIATAACTVAALPEAGRTDMVVYRPMADGRMSVSRILLGGAQKEIQLTSAGAPQTSRK